jgi:hypothetical protein
VLDDEDELMIRRGTVRSHGEDDEDEDGPTEEKRVFNRGERRGHDDEWEEPLLKRIKNVMERGMRAEATKARKRFKQAVTALSVMSYEARQKDFCKNFAAMTDIQLLAALEAGELEFSSGIAQAPVHQQRAGQPAQQPAQHPASQLPGSQLPGRNGRNLEPPQPSKQRKVGPPSADRHWGWGRQQGPSEETAGQSQPGPSSSEQPREEQPAGEPPQAGRPEAEPSQTAKMIKSVRKFWAKKAKKAARAAQATKAAAKSVIRSGRE